MRHTYKEPRTHTQQVPCQHVLSLYAPVSHSKSKRGIALALVQKQIDMPKSGIGDYLACHMHIVRHVPQTYAIDVTQQVYTQTYIIGIHHSQIHRHKLLMYKGQGERTQWNGCGEQGWVLLHQHRHIHDMNDLAIPIYVMNVYPAR